MSVWWLCAALLVGPSILVWLVRLAVVGMGCAPGPDVCRSLAVGAGFHDALDLAWMIGSSSAISLPIAFAAAIVALMLRKPLMASLSLMILPLAALVLPTLAVYTALYPGCAANEAGVGDCVLWGDKMGMSYHHAAMAPWIIYSIVPYSFALALMIGAIGMLFFRKPPEPFHDPFGKHRFARTSRVFDDSTD
ncbi:MAG: hypothetical protein ABSD74_07635 [Rhizomicrobium sp.]